MVSRLLALLRSIFTDIKPAWFGTDLLDLDVSYQRGLSISFRLKHLTEVL